MLYRFLRFLARLLFIFCHWKVQGRENLPREGPVIVAANHISNWDPIAVASALSRPVHFMAKEELFEHQVLSRLLTAINAFPVKRGSPDRKAIRNALSVLAQGEVLGIFPEGSRSKTGELAKPYPGIAMLALKARVPVIPVACIGTDRFLPWGWRKPFIIRIGKPLQYGEYYDTRLSTQVMETVSQDIMNKIYELLDWPQQDFSVQLRNR